MDEEKIIASDGAVDTDGQQEAEQETAEAEATPAQDVDEQMEALARERDEYLEKLKYQMAEFANYRRRTDATRREALDEGRRETISAFLPVLDNLERALQAAQDDSPLKEGVNMVLRQMRDTLSSMKVETIDPLGEVFDAEWMNAVLQGSEDEGKPGTVCQVLQKGYRIGDHAIRHAMVKVVAG